MEYNDNIGVHISIAECAKKHWVGKWQSTWRGFKCNVISCHVLYVWFFICFSKQVATSGFTGISKLHLVYESSDGRQICSRFGFQFEVRQCLSGSKIIFAKNSVNCLWPNNRKDCSKYQSVTKSFSGSLIFQSSTIGFNQTTTTTNCNLMQREFMRNMLVSSP